ncbi:Response regulator MprA [Aliarcobacter thereius]|uniref:Response regulator MprA n=2 Tax=Aliarcobacter thereius TaxID=544718 RepID=A0A1C0B761_9BACT|nr:response regulator transcription factor [Aliarcobacter thereius]OCL86875.1 Response regulator MprA [Aliarcobacter thereius]OCL91057.1 Response regulator MprA [Aliarcobacter thereius]OCL96089.1 Response regulator MprA [Aliarcobacter thereius LMG 24486]OCL99423.1 Response regulator MprA [Aliarcobacter thereius]QBF15939.1 two-component system response regulator [Aliarcobacter thereius LMG 24486]
MKNENIEKLKNLTILYAEDEEGIRKNIADSLSYYVKEVIEASNGEEAFKLYEIKKPDIILSDIHMPILNGIDFVKKVRQNNRNIPIIMITAFTDKKYLLEAVELHMEKYIVKPIELDELLDSLEKCLVNLDINNIILLETDENYNFDYDMKELRYKDDIIYLNKKEMLFFEVLISNKNRVTTYAELQNKVWQDDVMTDSALRSLVRNLRKKLPSDIILNLSGIGYRFV